MTLLTTDRSGRAGDTPAVTPPSSSTTKPPGECSASAAIPARWDASCRRASSASSTGDLRLDEGQRLLEGELALVLQRPGERVVAGEAGVAVVIARAADRL